MINVWGDSVVCGIVAHLSKAEIAEADQRAREKLELENRKKGQTNEALEMDEVKKSKRERMGSDVVDATF